MSTTMNPVMYIYCSYVNYINYNESRYIYCNYIKYNELYYLFYCLLIEFIVLNRIIMASSIVINNKGTLYLIELQ